jgi:hypothetical protein
MEDGVKKQIGCPRCQGLMVAEPFVDLMEFSHAEECFALRCVQCGEMIDRTIIRNRKLPLKPASADALITRGEAITR